MVIGFLFKFFLFFVINTRFLKYFLNVYNNKMSRQLPVDCLNDIFEYLEGKVDSERADLRSCLLVDHLWCEVSVRILWKNIQNFNTLITCLPNESKEILRKNE